MTEITIQFPDELVWTNRERLGGVPCFNRTRLPLSALFNNLGSGMTIDEFIECFGGVDREQVVGVLNAVTAAVDEPVRCEAHSV